MEKPLPTDYFRKNYSTNWNKYIHILVYTSKIIFRNSEQNSKANLFPIYCLFRLIKQASLPNSPAEMQSKFRLIPIPKKLYNLLIKNEFIRSEHYVICSEQTFEEVIKVKELNWINLNFLNGENGLTNGRAIENEPEIVSTILNKPNTSILVPILSVKKCEPNCLFVNENCYYNLINKYKLMETEEIYVKFQELKADQTVPEIATKATIFLINNPHEITTDVVDEVLACYFEHPRILYRNYTYEISLDAELLGTNLFAKYFHIFCYLKKIYFRCVHVESKENPFELLAVVAKGLTTLQQTTSINYSVPKQKLDEVCPIQMCPTGLLKYFNQLKSSILPFIPTNGNAGQMNASTLSSRMIFPTFLLQGDRGTGKSTILNAVVQYLGIQCYAIDCAEIVSQIPAQTEAKVKLVLAKANICEPLVICLYNFEIFGIEHEGREDLRIITMFQTELYNLFVKERSFPIIFVAISSDKQIKPLIQRLFLEIIKVDAPTADERLELLEWFHMRDQFSEEIFNHKIENIPLFSLAKSSDYLEQFYRNDIRNVLKLVAEKTQGFLHGDLRLLYDNSVIQMKLKNDSTLALNHFEDNLNIMQADFSDSLGAPKVPKVLWSDIGGLVKLKDEIQSSIGLPLKHMHLMGKNMRRSGILLYGPPGTGKTLVAKAVATECNLSFLSVQGPELLNMYVGQSEQNVREVFARARSAAPCVIFLDELDSLAPNRGVAGDSGGVMDRVVSQLLAEMDGMVSDSEPQKQIFILAATNRPDLIDPALLRPGRFDKLLYVGPCTTDDDKSAVLKAQMKRFTLAKNLTINSIVDLLKADMTGADLYSICSNAWLSAVRRTILNHSNGKLEATDLTPENVIVNLDDFKLAASNFVSSISKKDLEYFDKLRATFSP